MSFLCYCPVNGHNGKYCTELKHGNNNKISKQQIYVLHLKN